MDPKIPVKLLTKTPVEQSTHQFGDDNGEHHVSHGSSEMDNQNLTNNSPQLINNLNDCISHSPSDKLELPSDKLESPSDKLESPCDKFKPPSDKLKLSSDNLTESDTTESEPLNCAKIKTQQTAVSEANVNCKSDDAPSHSQSPYTQPLDTANQNYFVLLENPVGSQVVSDVIPTIAPSDNNDAQIGLNTVLQTGISYINVKCKSDGKGAVFSQDAVSMIIDPNLYHQDTEKIFIQQPAFEDTGLQTVSVSSVPLSVSHPSNEDTLTQDATSDKNKELESSVLLGSDKFPSQLNVDKISTTTNSITNAPDQNSNQNEKVKDPIPSNIELFEDIVASELRKTEIRLKEKYQRDEMRLLQKSHLKHQEALQKRRITKKQTVKETDIADVEEETNGIDDTEEKLKKKGIDDDTPIFGKISTKINPDLLLNLPGCQAFLLNEAKEKSLNLTLSSDLDCSFDGDIKDLIFLYNKIKALMKLSVSSTLKFDKLDRNKKSEWIPYITMKGRRSKLKQLNTIDELDEDPESDAYAAKTVRKRKNRRKKKNLTLQTHKKLKMSNDCNIPERELEGVAGKVIYDTAGTRQITPVKDEASNSFGNDKAELPDPIVTKTEFPDIISSDVNGANSSINGNSENNSSNVKAEFEDVEHLKSEIKEELESELPALKNIQFGPRKGKKGNVVTASMRISRGKPPIKFDPAELFRAAPKETEMTIKRRQYEEKTCFKFFCEQCSFKTKRQSQFTQHLRLHNNKDQVKHYCRYCDFISMSASSLTIHEITHKKNVMRCPICTVYVTDNKRSMYKHMNRKHSAKAIMERRKYVCRVCSAAFRSLPVLTKHKIMHTKQSEESLNSLSCTSCKKTFAKKVYLQRHLKYVHGPEIRPHLCDLCGMSFKRKDALQQHREVHLSRTARVLPYKCDVCGKGFRSKAHLTEHFATHTADRPFLCQYCGASFKTQAVQRRHIMRLHLEPRTHVCKTCCQQFHSKSALQKHENSHKSDQQQSKSDQHQSKSERKSDQQRRKSDQQQGKSDQLQSKSDQQQSRVKTEDIWDVEESGIKMSKRENIIANNVIVSMEDQTTALVVKAGTHVMVNPSLVPTIVTPTEMQLSEGTRSLIQNRETSQAFYYLADQLHNIH